MLRVAMIADLRSVYIREVLCVWREILVPYVKSKDGRHMNLTLGNNKPMAQPLPTQSHVCDTRPIRTPWGSAMDQSLLSRFLVNLCMGNPKCFTCEIKSRYRRAHCDLADRFRIVATKLESSLRTSLKLPKLPFSIGQAPPICHSIFGNVKHTNSMMPNPMSRSLEDWHFSAISVQLGSLNR
jgi:hypothetical protein